jgi:hypothetical protein
VPRQLVELDEGTLIEEVLDALPSRPLAPGVLLLDGLRRARVERVIDTSVEVGQLARRRVDVDALGVTSALTFQSRL